MLPRQQVNVDQLMGFLDKYSKYKREKRRKRKAAEAAQSLAAANSPSHPHDGAPSPRSHAHHRVSRTEAWAAPAAASTPRAWKDRAHDSYDSHRREDRDRFDDPRQREADGGRRERRKRHDDAISVDIARKMEREWASRRGEARENIDGYVDR